MNVKEFSKAKNGNEYLSTNFKVREFACNDGTDNILIDLDMIPILQKIRDVGGRVTINSAYRTPSYNKKVGGASNSYHTKGRAFDIVSERLSITDICNLANTLGVKGIIKYPSFVHIDSRETKYHADNKGNLLTFGYYKLEDKPMTKEEQIELIKEKAGLDDNTVQYLQFYRYGDALIEKLANAMK